MDSHEQNRDERLPADAGDVGQRLDERVHARLLARIRTGGLKLGERLPSENELAAEFGVSRPVVREALSRLREDGLIVSRRGAGSFVSSGLPSERTGFAPLAAIDDIASYFRFRRMLECQTASDAATRAGPADIRMLKDCVEDMRGLVGAGTATIDPDLRFHQKIAELSDNRFAVECLAMLRPHMLFIGRFVRSLGTTGYAIGKERMHGEHSDIIAALEARDPRAARRAMAAHIDASQQRVFKGEK